jgi:hypothetical protein
VFKVQSPSTRLDQNNRASGGASLRVISIVEPEVHHVAVGDDVILAFPLLSWPAGVRAIQLKDLHSGK